LYLLKGQSAVQKVLKEFPGKSWNEQSLFQLPGVQGATDCVYCEECDLGDLEFSQKSASQTH